MKAKNGIWEISQGKGDRIYINCNDEEHIMHPQELCNANGLGMYGYEHLKDLAIAILMFEQEKFLSESIMNKMDYIQHKPDCNIMLSEIAEGKCTCGLEKNLD